MTPPMTSLEMFMFLLVETDQPISEDGPSSYEQVAADVAAVRRYYVERGWIDVAAVRQLDQELPPDAHVWEDLDELCCAYVSHCLAGTGGVR